MPVYQYEDRHYDLPDGLSNEQAISKIKGHLGITQEEKGNSFLDNLASGAKGTAAAVGDIVAGIPKIGARTALAIGGKLADPSRNLQDTWDTAGQAIEETFPSFGKSMQDNIGYTVPMKPFELYGEGVEYVADKASLGNKDVQGALNIAGNFAPIPFAGKAVRGAKKVIETVDPGLRRITPESVQKPTPAQSAITALKAESIKFTPESSGGGGGAFDRMSQDLSTVDGDMSPYRNKTPSQDMASTLTGMGDAERAGNAQGTMDARQVEMEFAVKKQTLLDLNAQLRATQEAAPTISTAHEAVMNTREQTRLTAEIEKLQSLKQVEIDATPHVLPDTNQVIAPQYGAMEGVGRLDENGMPIRADLSIEAQNLQNPLQRNIWGDELGPSQGQGRSLTQAIDSMERTPIRDQGRFTGLNEKTEALKRLQGEIEAPVDMQVAIQKANSFKGALSGDARIGPKSTSSIAQNALRKRQGGAINPEVFKEGFEKVVKGVTSGIDYLIKSKPDETFGLNRVVVDAIDRTGKKVGEFTFGEKGENLHAFGSETVPEARRQGIAKGAYKVIADLGNDIVPSSLQSANGKAMWEGFKKDGTTSNGFIPKSQRGAIKIDWSKKREMEQLGKVKALRDVLPELTQAADTPEGIVAVAKNSPDIPDRGLARKTVSQFTKGMLYENFKTNNPVLKYTYQVISDAVDASSVRINKLIADTLTPVLRKLSDKEMGELGDVMVQAMKLKKELSPEFLREHGFNEKQIHAYETQKAIHAENFETLNKSRELAGKKPVAAYEGYIAGLASGNFRKIIYKADEAGKLEVVGIVGSDFRRTMESRVKTLLAKNPEYSASAEKFNGARNISTSKTALTEALTILSDNNPNFTEFAKALDDAMTSEGYNALGAKKHTLGKKGVFGMEGDKPWQSSYENAKDMFNAQIRYTETMAKWAEFSKAIDKLAVVFKDPEVQLQHPNALKIADDYVKQAMGQNPTNLGRGIDNLLGVTGNALGVGPNVMRQTVSLARNTVNTLFFSLNHAWMAVNVLQPFLVMPEIKAFLRGRGIELNLDITGVSDNLIKGGYSSIKHVAGWQETPFEKSIWKYAKEHGIDQTQLIESHNSVRDGPAQMISRGLKIGANAVEAGPRAMIFATLAQMLHDSGYSKDPALLDVARQLTDMSMADYRPQEQIKAIQQLGMAGGMAANLTSFKQNTLSRYALFGREMGKGNSGAFTTALVAAVAYAGVMGLPGFTEMDWVVKELSAKMNKPTTLSKLVLDAANDTPGKIGDVLAMGTGAYYGVDLHNRIGMPSAMPSLTGGFGKLADIGAEAVDFAKKPNEWNAKQLARQVALPPLQPWMDLEWFSHTNPETGENLSLNRSGMGTVVRNKEDLMFKRLGFLGSNESKGKALDYAATQQDKVFADKQKRILSQVQEIAASNKGNLTEAQINALIMDYNKVQGDPNKFIKSVENAGVNLNTTARVRRILANQGSDVSSANKLKRTRGE